MPLEGAPPPLLQIVRERLRPGSAKQYGEIEEKLLHACRTMGAPNRYLALVSADEPIEVWWLNMYESQSHVDRVANGYAENVALMGALRELSAMKTGLAEITLDQITTFRGDLSGTEPWRIGELTYAAVRQLPVAVKSVGFVFECPGGMRFAFAAAPDRAAANEAAMLLGEGARILKVQPNWSFPKESWVLRNPKLWSNG